MHILLWLSNNLRLHDNPALNTALELAKEYGDAARIYPLYIVDPTDPWPMQGARCWWLHQSLEQLGQAFSQYSCPISFFKGEPSDILGQLIVDATQAVVCSADFCAHTQEQQAKVKSLCDRNGITCRKKGGALLFNPYTNTNKQGNIYQVFTPFYKHSVKTHPPSAPQDKPDNDNLHRYLCKKSLTNSLKLNELALLPTKNWADDFEQYWQPGEQGAQETLNNATSEVVKQYSNDRDFPAKKGTSQLSPHLHFGEISPRQVWHTVANQLSPEHSEAFLRQLVWRDFSYSLIANWKDFPEKSFKSRFDHFNWKQNDAHLHAWQKGLTGYPIVDAGMRQLWQTGWMHNRIRMVVASFLTKHLRIHWIEGAKWFWDTLLDADLANNSAGWQWVAGSGADAAPYFRIFNPMTQSEKFDKKGAYIRKWIPELSDLPDKYIHAPWEAPNVILKEAHITLGTTYPKPIVDHKAARESALAAYKETNE